MQGLSKKASHLKLKRGSTPCTKVQVNYPYQCSHECGYSTKKSGDRNRHEKTCDKNPMLEIACTEWKQVFAWKLNYDQHVSVAHAAAPVTRHGSCT